jgi:maltose phosphorylase
MNQDYIKPDNWSIIEEGFDAERVKSSESLQYRKRCNGTTQILKKITRRNISGSYIAGIYIQINQSWLVEN